MSARQVTATVDLASNRCVISGDPVLLQQVFVNLMMNAMDAMVETPPGRRHVTISSEVRASDVDVSVRDTGPGLPAHILDTLFTPFVTTKARGLGIGLTIVRSIVDAHGGTIAARNNPDGGATFTRDAAPQRIGGGHCRTVKDQMFRVHSGWRCVMLAGLLMLATAPSEAAPPVRQVLLLQSFNSRLLSQDYLTANFRVDLDLSTDIKVVIQFAGA